MPTIVSQTQYVTVCSYKVTALFMLFEMSVYVYINIKMDDVPRDVFMLYSFSSKRLTFNTDRIYLHCKTVTPFPLLIPRL